MIEHKGQRPVIAGCEILTTLCDLDATHITAPSRSGNDLVQVIEQATRNKTNPVGGISAGIIFSKP